MTKNTFDAFDPGAGYCARARFIDGVLVDCRLITGLHGVRDVPAINLAVIEKVVTRGADEFMKSGKRPQDILDVAFGSGVIAGQYENAVMQRPHQVPKDIWQSRIIATLNGNEVVLLPRLKQERLHVIDAVGVGLKYLGRI